MTSGGCKTTEQNGLVSTPSSQIYKKSGKKTVPLGLAAHATKNADGRSNFFLPIHFLADSRMWYCATTVCIVYVGVDIWSRVIVLSVVEFLIVVMLSGSAI